MRYLSVCSGIEAATVAWHPLGWTPVAFSEIEPFPSAVLAHHYPNVPNYGDMTKFEEWPLEPGTVDLLVGGTPCQSFSVAGLRKGISDPRGGLMLTYLEIARRFRPRWIVWENVPGVLSSRGGRDFGSLLGGLEELGYGWAYRVLDAQWCRTHGHPRAVPQRRRRVFVVGCLGDWKRAAAVLFERESVQRDSSTRRTTRQGVAADAEAGAGAGCYWDGSNIANTLTRKGCDDRMPDKDRLFAVLQPVTLRESGPGFWVQDEVSGVLRAEGENRPSRPSNVVFAWQNNDLGLKQDSGQDAYTGRLIPQPVAGTLGNRGLRSHTELDGHGAYVPVAFGIYGGNKRQDRPEGGFYVREEDTARTLDAAQGLNPTCSQGGTCITQPIPYDLFQITAPVNRQNRQPGDPCHTLARDNAAHAAVVNMQGSKSNACVSTDGSSFTLNAMHGHDVHAVAHAVDVYNQTIDGDCAATLTEACGGTNTSGPKVMAQAMTVRRLTPRECERLQGFPDDYTAIPWRKKPADECPDGPRYKALGNSMAVNCMAWIGERIAAVDSCHDI